MVKLGNKVGGSQAVWGIAYCFVALLLKRIRVACLGDSWSGDTTQDGGVNLFQREGGKTSREFAPPSLRI